MGLVFQTRRRPAPVSQDLARRVAQPFSIADALTPEGVLANKRPARADRQTREARALTSVLPTHTLPDVEAARIGTSCIDPLKTPPDPRLVAQFGSDLCLKHRVIPWRNVSGRVTVLATSSQHFLRVHDALTVIYGPVHLAIVSGDDLDAALSRLCHKRLMENAEFRTADTESCRNWDARKASCIGGAVLLIALTCMIVWPQTSFLLLCGWAVFTLMLSTLLKAVSAFFHLIEDKHRTVDRIIRIPPEDLPVVTILLPLYRERDVAGALVKRISRLDYPADKLDVCLVLEADDQTTHKALANATLPTWMRAIRVPLGALQTKPRAMNYAMSFAKGSIVGVYDAEDAPDPDQIRKVVNRFAQRGPEVACLQGRLDFYNAHSNWLARCFTVEYATWFRVMLPGLERLGLAIPLGGTTLFFRRDILEKLGGWDAHNVTEDADLGIRLTRHGYRTEIIDTVTQEEANARAWPWVKQRSRWLKGYAITYVVHMRNPVQLWRDLGAWRFFGVQVLFGGTISQFLLAPLLWSFWLMLIGIPHPLDGVLSQPVAIGLACAFLLSEVIGISVSALAVATAKKPELVKWAPTLHFYFPLAALAAYKGVFELATKPFYWDKTSHGIFAPTTAGQPPTRLPQQPLHPIAAE